MIGYNHKMRILLETIVGKIAQFEVKPDRFSVIKVIAQLFSKAGLSYFFINSI